MTQIKIGVDNGNYNTKSSERMLYASGFAVSDREFITSEMQLLYEGTYYAVGGAELLGQRLQSGDVNTIVILDRFANAEGYKLLLG